MTTRYRSLMTHFVFGLAPLAVLFAGSTGLGDERPPDRPVHVFSVAKEINNSYVSYDVRLTEDCRIDEKDPLALYWVTPLPSGGTRIDGLNFVEKGLYGMDVQKTGPHLLIGEVKALKSRGVRLSVHITADRQGNRCVARATVSGPSIPEAVVIHSLFLKHYSGATPKQVVVSGLDSKTRQSKSYALNVG